jgi:hypothetical protein
MMVRGQRSANVRQEHDEYDERKFDDGGRSIDEEAFFEMLDKGRFKYEVEMWRLQANECAQKV